MPVGSGNNKYQISKKYRAGWNITEPYVSVLRHVPCTKIANCVTNIVVAIFNVGGIGELTCIYRCLEGFVTGYGPGWMLDKQIAQSLGC